MFETWLYIGCVLLTLVMLWYVCRVPAKGSRRFHEEDEICAWKIGSKR